MIATIGKERLTDGSYVYYVLVADSDKDMKFDCISQTAAEMLLECFTYNTVNVSTY